MRRLALFVLLTGGLVACTSLLGDFSVEPGAGTGGLDGGDVAEAGADGADDAPAGDAPVDGPIEVPQPIPVAVAANSLATCATVVYLRGTPNERAITFCWGAAGDSRAFLGAEPDDPTYDGFSRPRVPKTNPPQHLTFDQLGGNARGLAFLGRVAVGSQAGQATPYCWGGNSQAECGQPAGAGGTVIPPTPLVLPGGGGIRMESGSLAPYHGCLTTNGSLLCWGQNNWCEVRSGATSECNAKDPQNPFVRFVEDQMNGVIGAPDSNGQPAYRVDRFAGGYDHSCVVMRKAGAVEAYVACWGRNNHDQTGQGVATSFVDDPSSVAGTVSPQGAASIELSSGAEHTCAIVGKSQLVCWGRNDKGQAGPGKPAPAPPAPVSLPAVVPGSLGGLALGGDTSCFVTTIAGGARATCFGDESGPLGRAPADVSKDFAFVDGIKDVVQIAVGGEHACAIARGVTQGASSPHSLFCWGKNDRRQIAPSSTVQVFPTPHRVLFPTSPQ